MTPAQVYALTHPYSGGAMFAPEQTLTLDEGPNRLVAVLAVDT